MKLLLIRHGQSTGNAEHRMQGHFDVPLTELGRKQARALAARLTDEGWAFDGIYASDLSRAAETAAILGASYGLPVVEDARLREYDLGELNGIVWHDFSLATPRCRSSSSR